MDRDEICERFIDAVPFDLYPFQEEAVLGWFETEGGLLVAAPTGMGKTLIAETAVFEALHTRKRLYYTTPLIALTDQKLRELQDRAESWGFSRDDIGLITGNRRVNPDAPVKVVVAEILLNHLLSPEVSFDEVSGVVMDEFHYFNDFERGVVWELSLVLLPAHVRLLLLSATVGNAYEFCRWLREQHERTLQLITSDERKVPLEFTWVDERLLTDQLVDMIDDDDAASRVPALVFCFARDECWEMAERLKGLSLIPKTSRAEIEETLERADFTRGIGPKLRQMLIRGVGVHHAGVLPAYKEIVEELFTRKLIPLVICTETLAAGINLPARSVVLSTILKGKPGERKLLPASSAHQMFGRAGRPQFDTQGYVYCMAHEDDVRIAKWKQKYDQIDPKSTNPTIIRARKQLERKRPSRRKTVQYWNPGQFDSLIRAGPANLSSRSMIPYQFLVYLITHGEDVDQIRAFLRRRFAAPDKLDEFEAQLGQMLANLAQLEYLSLDEAGQLTDVNEEIEELLGFRSVHPLFGTFLKRMLVTSNLTEKLLALEGALFTPWVVAKAAFLPYELEKGPLQTELLEPMLIAMGVAVTPPEPPAEDEDRGRFDDAWEDDEEPERPPTFPEMLEIAFEAGLVTPEQVGVQTKWVAGGILDSGGDFDRFVGARRLAKSEGLVLRHLLRLVILAGEFGALTEDPDYQRIADQVTAICEGVDASYTERFLSSVNESRELLS